MGPLVVAIPGGGDLGDMLLRPFDETVEEVGGIATEIGELTVNAWGDRRVQRPGHEAVALERPQRLREHLLGDALELATQLSEAHRSVA